MTVAQLDHNILQYLTVDLVRVFNSIINLGRQRILNKFIVDQK